MAPPTTAPVYQLTDKALSPKEIIKGPSTYANTINEGPSVLKNWSGPLKVSGALDTAYKFKEITPAIGREYPDLQLKDVLENEEQLRDLAITISRRGVVFFRNQDITIAQQKKLADQLGKLAGKPETSGLHIHPVAPAGGFLKEGSDEIDEEVSIITSKINNDVYNNARIAFRKSSEKYHTDVNFEPVPADYTTLRIIETPDHGGDTLWASGYSLYDKLSPSLRAYLETLVGTYSQPTFKDSTKGEHGIYSAKRGAPENFGDELIAKHPVVRTNPVTGWKSIFSLGTHFTSFDGLTEDESTLLKTYIHNLLVSSHDIQVRFKWNKNDMAIWDNRSVFHTATNDYPIGAGTVVRTGVRTVSVGERPFFSEKSKSREEDLYENKLLV
ncbi:Jlp1p [Sugiyamaella lignohabitans]|uniref:Jlp1p n=1 Tax=Sugiyamaella lignohabitans TaxID=796027 RepID=A0A167CKV2_9ASCO|nr:Jlp1p [Sugiyamaella lignohabitans]ANB11826.1 Jlp1p [Sugiyamaella lignohabitans]